MGTGELVTVRGSGQGGIARRQVLAGLGAGAALTVLGGRAAAAAGPVAVDMALIMAVDASASIDRTALDFQLRGHAMAFRSPALANAIAGGQLGRIAVQLCQFAAPQSLATLVPWTVLSGAEECRAMADTIDSVPGIAMGGSTALGSAVVSAVERFDAMPVTTTRRVLDLVSNGFNNAGIDPRSAGAHAAAAGITVNGLAILDEYDWLDGYFAEQVIAGPGAFVRTAASLQDFSAAILGKLVAEIV